MTQGNLILEDVKIVTPLGDKAAKGVQMKDLHIVEDASIIIKDGIITYAGKASDCDISVNKGEYVNLKCKGNVVLPGFVDSHTHLVFGGFRIDEFEWRLKGDSYMSIMERGGGIQSTVDATREISKDDLIVKTRWFLDKISEMGVTTVEVKSGYGLDLETEMKILDVISELNASPHKKQEIVSTYMGAHAIPKEFNGNAEAYIDFIIDNLSQFKDKAKFCDIFCEKNVFELQDSRRLLEEAKRLGYGIKLHADEIVSLGGAELAADLDATSADHLLHISEEGIKRMSEKGVVATLLPLTAFALKEPYAPARKFIDTGCAVALATDLNPGSCFSGSIPLTIALACIYMNMTIEEVITALTLNGAAALGLADKVGTIEKGKRGDLLILGCDNYKVLPYFVGMNCVKSTIFHGRLVYDSVGMLKL